MGVYSRRDFSLGWQPSADAINAPPNALLRMDNCVLDERGAVALRPGSAKINSAALSSTDCHSLFTAKISGTKTRMTGATSAVFANGTSIATGFAGTATDDIVFGAHMGQVLMARSTTKKKYDGTTVRTWGIAAPGAAPTLASVSSDSKTFASCASTESPAMTSNEGSQAFTNDKNGTANAAVEITPDSTTARGTSTKTFASPTDFTTYDAGQTGTDDDLVEMDVFITEPQYLDRIALMIDVNDGTFQSDYYVYEFVNGQPVEVSLNEQEFLASDYTAEGYERDSVRARVESRGIESRFRIDKPVSNTGWNHFSVPRGKMNRIGGTSGKNWSTVKAVRVTFVGLAGGSGAALRFDQIQISGGSQRALTGRYKAICVAAYNNGTYIALSPPSAASSEIEVKGNGLTATMDATTVNALDSQTNELHVYLFGGMLDGYYRAAVLAGGPFTGSQSISIVVSDRSMLETNIRLDSDISTPPSSIIGIEGPHFDRTLALTSQYLYGSVERNPDGFRVVTDSTSGLIISGDVLRVGDATETALWVKKSREQIYVGTTRDIYRIDGDWTTLPNGSINVAKRPLGVTRPPISSAVAIGKANGAEVLVYLSSDGWTLLGSGTLTEGAVDQLWHGKTRHGVSPVNVTSSTARFRVAITKNGLYALTPEGSDTTSSATLHVYHFGLQRWYRYTYPQAFRSLYAEYDGQLIAGDASGYVRTLDEAAHTDDGTGLSVVVWSTADDNGQLFTQKEADHLSLRADTGSGTLTVGFYLDGDSSADTSVSGSADSSDTLAFNLRDADVSEFRQIQMRMTGTLSTFILRGWELRHLDRPAALVLHDTGFIDLTDTDLAWVRRINIKARASGTLTVQPYWDGTAGTARTVSAVARDKEKVYAVPLGREDKGTTARVTVASDDPSNVYWVEFEYNVSGKPRQKRVQLVPNV